MSKGEIYYIQETDEGTFVKKLELTDYRIDQLDRIEEKLDSILKKVNKKGAVQ